MTSLPFIIMQSNACSPVRSVYFRGDGDNGGGVSSATGLGDGGTRDGNDGLDSPPGGRRTGPEVGEDGDGDRDRDWDVDRDWDEDRDWDWDLKKCGGNPRAVIFRGVGPPRGGRGLHRGFRALALERAITNLWAGSASAGCKLGQFILARLLIFSNIFGDSVLLDTICHNTIMTQLFS